MYGQDAGISTATLWWALIIGLVVSGAVIYAAIRLALIHDRALVKREAAEAERKGLGGAAEPGQV